MTASVIGSSMACTYRYEKIAFAIGRHVVAGFNGGMYPLAVLRNQSP